MPIHHLTFTRFIAALSVVIFHYGATTTPFDITPFSHVFQAGPIAVSYFYALSGFIMAIAYYRPDRADTFNKWKYWLARFARIYPVYLLALLLVFVANYNTDDLKALFLNLTLFQSWFPGYPRTLNAPGWSLSVEAFFYFCFPFILWAVYRHGVKGLVVVTALLWLLTQIIHTYALNSEYYQAKNYLHDFIYYNPVMHINTFLLGLIVGIFFKQNYDRLKTNHFQNTVLIVIVSVGIALLLMLRPHFPQWFGINVDFTNGLLAPLSLVFIVLLGRDTGILSRIFSYSWLILLGEASYSLYILQRPVYGIYEKLIAGHLNLPDGMHFYAYLFLLISLSILSFKLFESPMRHLINRLYKRPAKIG
jgi:peptidoglycan/LPS O-acetylase OafA/YrhL